MTSIRLISTPCLLTRQASLSELPIPATFAAALLLASSTMALADDSANSIRSNEGLVYSSEQISIDLASPHLPDPADALTTLLARGKTVQTDQHFLDTDADDAWITDVGVQLYRDNDQDGYFAGFSLSIDADTDNSFLEVHAVIDIQQRSSGVEFLHQTADFSLYGNALSDAYRVEIELVQNYPTSEFDLLIDLVDSNSGRILDSISREEFSNLMALPLESEDFDNQRFTPTNQPDEFYQERPQNDDVLVVEYVGSTGYFLLLAIGALALLRRFSAVTDKRFAITDIILSIPTRTAAQLSCQKDQPGHGRVSARTQQIAG